MRVHRLGINRRRVNSRVSRLSRGRRRVANRSLGVHRLSVDRRRVHGRIGGLGVDGSSSRRVARQHRLSVNRLGIDRWSVDGGKDARIVGLWVDGLGINRLGVRRRGARVARRARVNRLSVDRRGIDGRHNARVARRIGVIRLSINRCYNGRVTRTRRLWVDGLCIHRLSVGRSRDRRVAVSRLRVHGLDVGWPSVNGSIRLVAAGSVVDGRLVATRGDRRSVHRSSDGRVHVREIIRAGLIRIFGILCLGWEIGRVDRMVRRASVVLSTTVGGLGNRVRSIGLLVV